MGFHYFTAPSDWSHVRHANARGIFALGDPLTFSFTSGGDYNTGRATVANAYTVRNYYGTVVASGAVTPGVSSITLAALPLGWYKLYLTAARSDANYGTACGDTHFCVVRTSAVMQNPVTWNTTGTGAIPDYGDFVVRGLTLCGPCRHIISPSTSDPTGLAGDLALTKSYYANANVDAARPRPVFASFTSNSVPLSAPQVSGITARVGAYYDATAGGLTYFEGPTNEPDATAPATVASAMTQFYDAVKAGNASAQVIGPSSVSFKPTWIDGFLAAGGGASVDALAVHAYNNVSANLASMRRAFSDLKAVLTARSFTKPLWITEWGTMAATYGVHRVRAQAQEVMMAVLCAEQNGVPKERFSYFYDQSHGFWDFPSFWRYENWSVAALVPIMRVFSEEVFGKGYSSALLFPAPFADLILGSLYTSASTGDKVAVFAASGMTDAQVALGITGASTVVVVDCWGTTTTVPVVAGSVTLTVGMEPAYLRLPSGVVATVRNVASAAFSGNASAKASSSAGTANESKLNDGKLWDSYYLSGSSSNTDPNFPYYDATATLPGWMRLDFLAGPQTIDRVLIESTWPWQLQTSLLDFDVQTLDANGTTWTTRATYNEPTLSVASVSGIFGSNCLVDSYFSNRWVWDCTFAKVTTTAVRIYVRSTTYGGNPDATASAAGGQGLSYQEMTARQITVMADHTLVRSIVLTG